MNKNSNKYQYLFIKILFCTTVKSSKKNIPKNVNTFQ